MGGLAPDGLDGGAGPAHGFPGFVDGEREHGRHLVGLGHGADGLADEVGRVAAGDPAGLEPDAGQAGVGEAVDAEGAPAVASHVPGHQVPAGAGAHQVVRLHQAAGLVAVPPGVVEAHLLGVAAGLGEERQRLGVDGLAGRPAPLQRGDAGVQRADPAA